MAASPGPGNLLVISTSAQQGVNASLLVTLGILTGLLPPFISPDGNLAMQYGTLITTQMVVTFLVLALYAFSTRKLTTVLRAYGSAFNSVTGGLFVSLALYLGLSAKS